MDPSTNYFWKIDIKDNHGGQTDGQIWNFKTDFLKMSSLTIIRDWLCPFKESARYKLI